MNYYTGTSLRLLLCLVGVLVANALWAQDNGRMPAREAMLHISNIKFPRSGTKVLAADQWTTAITAVGSRYLRIQFSDIQDDSKADYEVVLYSSDLTRIRTYTKAEFSSRRTFWSPRIAGDYVRVMVLTPDPLGPSGLKFSIPQYIYEFPGAVQESLRDPLNPKLRPVSFFSGNTALQTAAKAVAKLHNVGRDGLRVCTGFMVAVDLLLTNEHCVPNKRICEMMQIRFDWVPDVNDDSNLFVCRKLEKVDPNRDFALVRVNEKPGEQWGQLQIASRETTKAENVYIVQYPGVSEPKQIALQDCIVRTPSATGVDRKNFTDFGHLCDTKSGSSGSPVLTLDHQVIGLHHWGFETADPRWMDENRAVRMKVISSAIGTLLHK